jgi:hypothetical protein
MGAGDMALNVKTAKPLGLAVLPCADEVIR